MTQIITQLKDKANNDLMPVTVPSIIPYTNTSDPTITNVKEELDGLELKSIPKGGTINQVLAKKSATDYDLKWVTGGTGGGGSAADTTYDDTVSQIGADNVQIALEHTIVGSDSTTTVPVAPLNADTLETHPASYFAVDTEVVKAETDTTQNSVNISMNADTFGNQLPAYYAKQSDMNILNNDRGYLAANNINNIDIDLIENNGKYAGKPIGNTPSNLTPNTVILLDVTDYQTYYATQTLVGYNTSGSISSWKRYLNKGAGWKTWKETATTSQIYNPNLLDNAYFIDPINQRGQNSYTNNGYTIDRWICDATLNILSDSIEISNGTLYQPSTEINNIRGKICTGSIMFSDGTIKSGHVQIPITTSTEGIFFSDTSDGNTKMFVYTLNADYVQIGFYTSTTKKISKIKLELGTISTLANDPPPKPQAELAECQRYQLKLGGVARYRPCQIITNLLDFFIPTPVTMRVNPTIDVNSISIFNLSGVVQTGFTFQIVNTETSLNGIVIRCTKSNHGLTDAILSITTGTIADANL